MNNDQLPGLNELNLLWAAVCEYASTRMYELRQYLYDRWYAIDHS